jgi:hypothetical protein
MSETTEPEIISGTWTPPFKFPDDLDYELVPKNLTKARSHHKGLSSIEMQAQYRSTSGDKESTSVLSYKVPNGSFNSVPDLSPAAILQVFVHRASHFVDSLLDVDAIASGGKVTFTLLFYTRDEVKRFRQSQTSFCLLAVKESLLDGEDEEEGETEEGEDEEEEEGEEGEEVGEEGEEEEDEDSQDERARRLLRLRSVGLPRVGRDVDIVDAGIEDQDDAASFAPPSGRRRPGVRPNRMPVRPPPNGMPQVPRGHGVHRSMHMPNGPQGYMPNRMSPQAESDMVGIVRTMMELQVQTGQAQMARDAHYSAELRASMRCMTEQYTAMMEFARLQAQDAQASMNKAHQRLYDISTLSGSFLENQAMANQQGWAAFQGGMQMRMDSFQQQASFQQQVHALQLEQLAKNHAHELERERERATAALPAAKGSDSGRSSFVRSVVAPLGVAITSEVLRHRGNEAAAELLEDTAKHFLGDDEDEADDEDDEAGAQPSAPAQAPIPTAPRGRRSGPASADPDPENPNPPVHLLRWPAGWVTDPEDPQQVADATKRLFDESPVVAMLRMLRAWLTNTQRKQMTTILGNSVWRALTAASEAEKDAVAVLKLAALGSRLKGPGIREKVEAVLSSHQRQLFDDLLGAIEEKLGKKKVVETTATAADQ